MTGHSSDPFRPYAVIDVGTNTLRLLVGYAEGGRLIRFAAERAVTRLGRNLARTGILEDISIHESIQSILLFQALIEQHKVQKVIAVGTSALRDAANSDDFIDAVKAQTGISISIISGDEEAELTTLGVLGYADSPAKPAFVADIGGGSTEWILSNDSDIRSSVQIGAVRLHEQFILRDPPSRHEIDNLRNAVFEAVTESFLNKGISSRISAKEIRNFIATGGTATAVAAIDMGLDTYIPEKIHLHRMSFQSLKALLEHLASIPLFYRAEIKGLESERADIIIPGIVILLVLMETLKTDTLTVSDYGLLEGILLKQVIGHGL